MSSNTPPPLGYISIDQPTSLKETFENFRATDKAVTIAKSAIQNYINSFLDPCGVNRAFLTSSVSPSGLQFVTQLSYDDQMKVDPNLQKTYLARFFVENKGELPSILIIDTGVTYQDQGLTDLIGASSVNGRWQASLSFYIKIQLSVSVAAQSEEDASTLASVLVMLFGPLAYIVNGHIIHGEKQIWELRLPNAGLTMGQASTIQVEGDSKNTIFMRALDFSCDFETRIKVSQPLDSLVPPVNSVYGVTGPNQPVPKILNLQNDGAIPLGQPYQLFIENMRTTHKLACSDP